MSDKNKDKIENKDIIDNKIDTNKDIIENNTEIDINKKDDNEVSLDKKANKKRKYIIGLLTTIICGSAFGVYKTNKLVNDYNDKVYPNTFINDIDVTGYTKDELLDLIDKEIENLSNKSIKVTIDDYKIEKTLKDFSPTYLFNENEDKEVFIENIMNYGKDNSFIDKLDLIVYPNTNNHSITYNYDHKLVDNLVADIHTEVSIKKVEPTLTMSSYGKFYVNEGKDGYSFFKPDLIQDIENTLDERTKDDISFKMNKEIEKRTTDISLLKSVNKKISSYSTTYATGTGRSKNVELATKKIDNTVLLPGEEFSYVEKVAPVSKANGYKEANVYSNGKVTSGIGGGICQVSSTLYNAQLKAGIVATERRNHSMPVGYVPLGQDATMSSGSIDLKFVNTYDYPIFINAYTSSGKLTIEIWSNENATEGIEYSVYTKVYDNNLKAKTYLYGYKNGKKVVNKFLHTSTYKPIAKEE